MHPPGREGIMAGEYFEIVKATNRQYFWRLRSANHRIIGNAADTYINKQHAIDMAHVVRSLSVRTPIYDRTGE